MSPNPITVRVSSSPSLRLDAGEQGYFRGHVFPGLRLDAPALLRDDLAAVIDLVRKGLASPEHAGPIERFNR